MPFAPFQHPPFQQMMLTLPTTADAGYAHALPMRAPSLPPVRAAALWDLAESYQARQDRPGIFGALEAYRELASLPLGLQACHLGLSPGSQDRPHESSPQTPPAKRSDSPFQP